VTKQTNQAKPRTVLYVLRFINVGRGPGIRAQTCREEKLSQVVQSYTRKIMRKQLRAPFRTVSDIELVHCINGTDQELKAVRKQLKANPPICPCCGKDLRYTTGAINLAAGGCDWWADATMH
jgi:hypothetical protein